MKKTGNSFVARWMLGAVMWLGSLSASAAIVGVPGEALLVPLAAFTYDKSVHNTFVYVTAPKRVGTDTIISGYTLPNVSPDVGEYQFPASSNTVYWYFYGNDGVFESGASGSFSLGPDETYIFDWRAEAMAKGLGATLDGQPGYLVFANASARGGNAATFAIEAEAFLTTLNPGLGTQDHVVSFGNAQIPVIPLSDGNDQDTTMPMIGNEVLYDGGNVPTKVSPIVSGLRLSSSAATALGLPLLVAEGEYLGEDRFATTLMVLWLDKPGPASRTVSVVDSLGNTCDATLDLSNGLNTLFVFEQQGVIKVNDNPFVFLSPAERSALPNLCYPANPKGGADLDSDGFAEPFENVPGYVEMTLPQGTGGQPTAVAFSVMLPMAVAADGAMQPAAFGAFTVMGKDRGKR